MLHRTQIVLAPNAALADARASAALVDYTKPRLRVATVTELEKEEPQRELHLARQTRRSEFAEPRVHLTALCIKSRSRIERTELRMVERVVQLPTELQLHRFAHGEDEHGDVRCYCRGRALYTSRNCRCCQPA